MTLNINDLPPGQQDKVRKQLGNGRKVKSYSKAQVVGAASSALAAMRSSDLPIDGMREALEMAKRWLKGLKN